MGEHNKAIEFLTKALSLKRSVQDLGGEAKVLNDIALVYSKLREYEKSLDFYNQALSLARSDGNRAGEAVALSNIGFLFQKQNQITPAISFYKQSISIYETLRDDINSLSRSEQSLYTQKISDTYRILADLLIKENRLTEAQHILELLKIREIQENEINRPQNQTSIKQLPVSIIEKQEISKINPKFAKDIQFGSLPETDRLSPTNPLNQSAQALLNAKPNSALIYHLITKDNLWIILATPDGKLQKFSSNAKQTEIESLTTTIRKQIEKCEEKYEMCNKNDTQTLNQTTQKLYQPLFPPDLQSALTQAKTQHLTLALDGSLRNIPIAALHTGSQYLIEQYTLATIIAAQLTDPTDKIPSTTTQTPILAVGTSQPSIIPVPDFVDRDQQDNFSALANTPFEVNTIVNPSAFPGSIFLDNTFTLANLQQHLPKARLFHIASHGIFRPNFLDYSYILMGNNQRWSIAQMDSDPNAKLFQNIHMVTLSACQTGLSGRDKTGMEIAGMSHAFMSKGAKAVTASLWQVEDESTAMFMQHYYRNLTTQTKAKALQTAQLKLLRTPRVTLVSQLGRSLSEDFKRSTRFVDLEKQAKSQSSDTSQVPKTRDYTHPYYWAPFILIGNSL